MIAPLLLLLGAAGATAPDDVPAYSVPAQWHLIEGIASDGKRVWVSSVVDRAVLELAPGGVRRVLTLPVTMGAPFGLAWDQQRRWLWVAAMCPSEPAIPNCGTSGLYAIDAGGKVRRSLTVTGAFNPGDVSVDPARGRVFVSDSLNGAIFSCTGACTMLDAVIRPAERASAQGSVMSPDGKSLIVADYSRGIVKIDLATGTDMQVRTADGKRLRGVDGLARIGSTYVAIQNPGNPASLVTFGISTDGLLENPGELAAPPIAEATQLVRAGDRLLVVADAQWRHYAGKDAKGAAAQAATPIMSVPLANIGK